MGVEIHPPSQCRAETGMPEWPTRVGALTTTLASVQSLVWHPPMCGAKPGLRQALWGAHLLVRGIYLHCCMPHTSLRLPFWEGHWRGDAPNGEWGRGKAKAAVVCLSPEIRSGRESPSQPPLSLHLSQLFFSLSLPFFLPLLSPSI